jgi:hypothetical protein
MKTMSVTTTLSFDIRRITGVQILAGGLEVVFSDGSRALLESSHPQFDILRINAEARCSESMPVGVVLEGGGRIVDLHAAHDVRVRSVCEDSTDAGRLVVAFWGYSPICYLTRDHPEFERLRSTLSTAASTSKKVWIANHSTMMTTDPVGDVEGETWWKLMDVRLA